MLQEERLEEIRKKLQEDGRVLSAELAKWLEISEDTVRRDLAELAARGQLRRVHGGAVPLSTTDPDIRVRSHERTGEKQRIAAAAARLIQPGQLLFLDAGSTVLELARRMPRDFRGTVVTHCTATATALAEFPNVDILLIGGRLLKSSLTAVGAETIAAYQKIRADICFLGICSIHAEFGVTDLDHDECLVKRAMIRNASRTVVLATGDKLGGTANYEVAPISELDYLLTDESASAPAVEALREAGLPVERVH
ncbi:DeoR/GlpR family transcriptional regulator of sugar metabolism [Haloferula luteola]|uniref:DeoR/GlpR family transcriptional regulator of sugar metabolism n=1 Tax=Haloferula luteola TaxID=595692 RepID=A0A840V118_9BACT|nr:DeoR/GlpR family DNA-binding transcription regulator [Haloferula luteola]MBB5351692.1 DeoR/GlpR family transcriptional regulator of sugar metabolism [Haloferula luteola]